MPDYCGVWDGGEEVESEVVTGWLVVKRRSSPSLTRGLAEPSPSREALTGLGGPQATQCVVRRTRSLWRKTSIGTGFGERVRNGLWRTGGRGWDTLKKVNVSL